MNQTLPFFTNRVAIFGAGHIGQELAVSLLRAGLPRQQLHICHRGSDSTRQRLDEAGLAGHIAPPAEVLQDADVVFYAVRPKDFRAIECFSMRDGALLVSLVAGIPISRLNFSGIRVMRLMPSSPDTLLRRDGIAAIYPDENQIKQVLHAMGVATELLAGENQMHAYTVLGPCMPMALTYAEQKNKIIDESAILDCAQRFGIQGMRAMLTWAQRVRPRFGTKEEYDGYFSAAATPGGVTEAILRPLDEGFSLIESLELGIRRSRELENVD